MNILIFVLLAVTVIALFAYQNGLDVIEPLYLHDYPYLMAETDSADGGASAVKLSRTDSSIIVDYELKEGYAYPYVGVKIFLGDGKTRGKDLSRFDSIFVWVKPRGEGTVRLYMRGYDSTFSRPGDETSLKFNEIEFFPLEETYPAVFVPQEFRVAGWWVAQNEINVHKARVDLSNVPLIEIQTGTNAPLGYGTLEIKGLCFKGKKIEKEELATALVALWFITFFVILVIRFFDYSRERAANKKKREELEKNLRALEIEKSEYEKSSKEDPLTGCLNRAGFSSVLMREQENLSKNDSPVSFVILDIDHFKQVNDTYGHACGDEVLKAVAHAVRGMLRKYDVLARYGGEEFLTLLPETDLEGAKIVAERFRKTIEDTTVIFGKISIKVTITLGVAQYDHALGADKSIQMADRALYEGKETGRNKVIVWKPES
jgi:diguanylate cyclase (GGDEF)-like protein